MKLGKTLHVTSRRAWRSWLAKHHKTDTEIWLVYQRKASGKGRVSYSDAVEEALCYGWIDSTMKSIDAERFAQRFSVRRKRSGLSPMNRERVRALIARRRMTKAGLAAIAHVFDPAKDRAARAVVPADIERRLKAVPAAWANFRSFPESYKRIRIAYIEHGRRRGSAEFRRRLQHFVRMTAQGKRFGYVRG